MVSLCIALARLESSMCSGINSMGHYVRLKLSLETPAFPTRYTSHNLRDCSTGQPSALRYSSVSLMAQGKASSIRANSFPIKSCLTPCQHQSYQLDLSHRFRMLRKWCQESISFIYTDCIYHSYNTTNETTEQDRDLREAGLQYTIWWCNMRFKCILH